MLFCHLMVNLMDHSWGKSYPSFIFYKWSKVPASTVPRCNGYCLPVWKSPDFFVTFTCNPRWQEITDALLPSQTAENHQDIVARVFKLKLKSLLHDLFYGPKPILGRMVALIYVIEWQKRGPPHAHILGICDNANKPKTIADYDSVVCAEIPNKDTFPELHAIVTMFMMHGPVV